MTNHVHLLFTPSHPSSAGDLMKRLGQRYVQYINRTYKRSGTLWEGRYRSSIVQKDEYLLICQRYIEMNPVRAGIVKHPEEYRWSSYQSNGKGEKPDILTPHELYRSLGNTDNQRQAEYRELFRHQIAPGDVDKIRRATNGNFALGTDKFSEEVSKMISRRVSPGKAGRPRKTSGVAG